MLVRGIVSSVTGAFILILLASGVLSAPSGPVDVELEQTRPGLIAAYRSLNDPTARLTRIDAKPAFYLGHSSPHPRLPARPLEVVWTGLLWLRDPGPVTFDAWVGGELSVEVDGVVVLRGKGESDTSHLTGRDKLDRPRGFYPITIRYRSLPGVPARLQIGWEGPTFAREPLPAWHLKHTLADLPALAQEELAGRGRDAAGRFGCARCHSSAFPGVSDPVPGPVLGDLSNRVQRDWLLRWLEDPAGVHPDTRMPALFSADRTGLVERWLIADALLGPGRNRPAPGESSGNHRTGRLAFINLGCTACHPLPDLRREDQIDLGRYPLRGLGDRLPADALAAFLTNPHARYPDGRMPRLPVTPETARHIAAYLLLWAGPTQNRPASAAPSKEEIAAVVKGLKVRNRELPGQALMQKKGCTACHPGLEATRPMEIPITRTDAGQGCLSGKGLPRFALDAETRRALEAYGQVARRETHPSPFAARQRLVQQSGCLRCHQRDSDRPPPLEEAGSTLGGSFLQLLPFQRTPRLNEPLQKYTRSYLSQAIREGVSGLRSEQYSYRMPAFGAASEALVQALAEGDGELPAGEDPPARPPTDPTLGSLAGAQLAGFQGYSCVSCHLWQGQQLSQPDPGALGPELTRLTGRIRRDWFDRFLDNPARSHPGTPMPSVFFRGKPALLGTVLDGDPARQKEALWSYFALGSKAPSPKPPPPLAVTPPAPGGPPLVAQIPIRLADGTSLESISILTGDNDLLLYDVGAGTLHSLYLGGRILREVQGRLRRFIADGTLLTPSFAVAPSLRLLGADQPEAVQTIVLQGYDLLPDGVRIRSQAHFLAATVDLAEVLRFPQQKGNRLLLREIRAIGVPKDRRIELLGRIPDSLTVEVTGQKATKDLRVMLARDKNGAAAVTLRYHLPAAQPLFATPATPPTAVGGLQREEVGEGLVRPGYRSIPYPRPRAASGEDLLMPSAVAAHPRDGRVFVASMKMGEIFVLRDPTDDGKSARFENYARGLFQEAYSMLAEEDALYVLHRRNLTRIRDSGRDGLAQHIDRVAALPHGVAETYDYGYGLVRDRSGAIVFSFAPHANKTLPGSGGALRLIPGQSPQEIAYGFRNPLGWCRGPEGEVFFTDNQGEWVATNKLCHLVEGRFYGYPNQSQRQHTSRPLDRTALWIPYDWARSINGVAYDNTGGKFGPFAGQFFLAELMFGGAIIRGQLEKVNSVYQGACFPFWGKGLLGPLCLTFDSRGRMWVGSITEPGWMAQPDRGALYRIDYTGTPPFEIQSIHVRPKGFRLVFTAPVSVELARNATSYQIEHYRYEYTGAYGSPEMDRTRLAIERVAVAPDGRSVEVTTGPLVKDRVYLITAREVRSMKGETLIHPTGAYTLHEVP